MVSDIVGVKQKMQHFTIKCCIFCYFITYYYFVVDFGYSEGESLSCGMCLITFSTAKEYSMGTTQPIRNKDELDGFQDVL